jgi:hypothetical protein
MKRVLVLLTLIGGNAAYSAGLNDFLGMGCSFSNIHSDWYIDSKLSENSYEVTIKNRPRNDKAIINLKSVSFETKGRINSFIFLKKVKTQKMKTQSGFDVKVNIYNESAECAEYYYRNIDVNIMQNGIPRLPHVWEEMKAIEKKEAKVREKKRINKLIELEKKELLKKISLKGYEKLKKEGCYFVGENTPWKISYIGNDQPPKYIGVDIVTTKFAYPYGGMELVKNTGTKKKIAGGSYPWFTQKNCKSIYLKHQNKKSKKRQQKRKKAKSLYE